MQNYLSRGWFLCPIFCNTYGVRPLHVAQYTLHYFSSPFPLWTRSNNARLWHKYWVKGLRLSLCCLLLPSEGCCCSGCCCSRSAGITADNAVFACSSSVKWTKLKKKKNTPQMGWEGSRCIVKLSDPKGDKFRLTKAEGTKETATNHPRQWSSELLSCSQNSIAGHILRCSLVWFCH